MLKITLKQEDLRQQGVLDAFLNLSQMLAVDIHQDLNISSHEKKARPINKPLLYKSKLNKKRLIDMSPRSNEIDLWVSFLAEKQKKFVLTLRKEKKLTLSEVAFIFGIEESPKNLKKHVNGLIGSIIRWSKSDYLNNVAKVKSTMSHKQVRFLPPWFCDEGVYHWQIRNEISKN